VGRGHALWLLPEPRAFARLAGVIAEIARAEGSPRFDSIGRDWNEPCLLDRLAVVRPDGPPESWVRSATLPLGHRG